ncbi:hypothetical protein JM93_03867 [Roseibium hamelinense]|uniref:Uncharacterized protein n=1 Tax=Roseibium hamelinense TaxID=150831 RepID=A0A562SKT3_9HYPH|nr:hypothetical protein JM93_03867 [Roseibium hamelinense]
MIAGLLSSLLQRGNMRQKASDGRTSKYNQKLINDGFRADFLLNPIPPYKTVMCRKLTYASTVIVVGMQIIYLSVYLSVYLSM